MRIYIDPERPAPRKLAPAVEALRRDEVIIYPTDTGYAFGCALSSAKGMATLRRLKDHDERSRKPLAMIVGELSDVSRYGVMGNRVFRTVRRILPGPYTIVLQATREVPRSMKNRDHEIGLRIPDHPVCRMLVELLGEPLLTGSVGFDDDLEATSEPALEDPEFLETAHGTDVALVIDAGHLWPDPSTVLRGSGDGLEVLREGLGPVPA